MANYKIGQGNLVSVGKIDAVNSAIVVFTTLAGAMDVELPDSNRDEVEVTSQDSKGQKEFIAGLIDNGEVSIEMNWETGSATDTILKTVKASGENVQIRFQINPTVSGNTVTYALTETYYGFCKSYTRSAPVGEALTATATFRISAQIS